MNSKFSGNNSIKIARLDHLVLTVSNVEASATFYLRALGFETIKFGNGRTALLFGNQKINLHPSAAPIEPHAKAPTPGSADLCFIADTPIAEVITLLSSLDIAIEEGPVERTGAMGAIKSVYFRDPDGNLVEVSNYLELA